MKHEWILREVLMGVLDKKERFFQNKISRDCRVSIGLVNKTVRKLEEIGSVQIFKRGFSVIDPNKILFYWASRRSMKKELKTYYIKIPAEEIEKTLPSCAYFTGFSGWRLLSKRTPVDYREVYIYVPESEKERIELWLKDKKPSKGPANLCIIFTRDAHLIKNAKKNIVPLPQIFVDIYSIASIQSKYFINDILKEYPVFGFEA